MKSANDLVQRLIFYLFFMLPTLLLAQSKASDIARFETGQFKKVKQNDLADVTRVITESEIRLRGANNLKDILLMEVGGIFSYDALKGWQFQWHGSSKGNILLLIDGLPFRSVQFDEMDLQQIPLDNISRIEIIENPQGVSYGSSAIMGIINIISKATQMKVYKPTLRFQGYNPGSFYSNVNLGRRTTEDYFRFSSSVDAFAGRQGSDSGRVLHWLPYTRVNNQIFYSHKVLQYMDVSIGFNNLYENKTQLGYPFPQTIRAYDREIKTNNNTLYFGVKGKLTQYYTLQGDLQLMDYRRHNTLLLKDVLSARQIPVNDTALNDTIHYTYIFSRWVLSQSDKNKALNYQAGFDISSTNDKYKPVVRNVNQVNTTTALFINLSYKGIQNLNLHGGLRLPYTSKYKTKVLWDLKSIYRFSPLLSLKFMVARSTKAPTFDQLFATYLTNGYSIKRNLNLTDESVMSYHYSLSLQKKTFQVEAGFFNYFFKNGIELVNDKYSPGRLIHKNISEKKTIGTRINLAYENRYVDVNVRGVFTGNNYFANLFDKQLFYSELYSSLGLKWPEQGAKIFYISKLTSERGYMLLEANGNINTYFLNPYYLADAIVEKEFNKSSLLIRLGVKNIFNIKSVSSFYLNESVIGSPQQEPFNTPLLGGTNYFIELNINL